MRLRVLSILIILMVSSCGTEKNNNSFTIEHALWHEKRIERLKSETGWLNIVGLYWLKEGENTIGSDSSNNIVFPHNAPAYIGKYILDKDSIRFVSAANSEIGIVTDKSAEPTLLKSGSLAWFIIERSPRYGIRLRDYENPAIEDFHGIETFPADVDWNIIAEFETFLEPRELLIPTVIGTVEKNICPGILRFMVNGVEQELYPSEAGEGLFLVFADETSGHETYGGGRFLYIDSVGKDGNLHIDFNRAYNPPCAFTPFATCPLPPRENFLSVRIEAGEKFAGH